nr:MAG TPA: hypothetical protein [Caudoviricetes sp.]
MHTPLSVSTIFIYRPGIIIYQVSLYVKLYFNFLDTLFQTNINHANIESRWLI